MNSVHHRTKIPSGESLGSRRVTGVPVSLFRQRYSNDDCCIVGIGLNLKGPNKTLDALPHLGQTDAYATASLGCIGGKRRTLVICSNILWTVRTLSDSFRFGPVNRAKKRVCFPASSQRL